MDGKSHSLQCRIFANVPPNRYLGCRFARGVGLLGKTARLPDHAVYGLQGDSTVGPSFFSRCTRQIRRRPFFTLALLVRRYTLARFHRCRPCFLDSFFFLSHSLPIVVLARSVFSSWATTLIGDDNRRPNLAPFFTPLFPTRQGRQASSLELCLVRAPTRLAQSGKKRDEKQGKGRKETKEKKKGGQARAAMWADFRAQWPPVTLENAATLGVLLGCISALVRLLVPLFVFLWRVLMTVRAAVDGLVRAADVFADALHCAPDDPLADFADQTVDVDGVNGKDKNRQNVPVDHGDNDTTRPMSFAVAHDPRHDALVRVCLGDGSTHINDFDDALLFRILVAPDGVDPAWRFCARLVCRRWHAVYRNASQTVDASAYAASFGSTARGESTSFKRRLGEGARCACGGVGVDAHCYCIQCAPHRMDRWRASLSGALVSASALALWLRTHPDAWREPRDIVLWVERCCHYANATLRQIVPVLVASGRKDLSVYAVRTLVPTVVTQAEPGSQGTPLNARKRLVFESDLLYATAKRGDIHAFDLVWRQTRCAPMAYRSYDLCAVENDQPEMLLYLAYRGHAPHLMLDMRTRERLWMGIGMHDARRVLQRILDIVGDRPGAADAPPIDPLDGSHDDSEDTTHRVRFDREAMVDHVKRAWHNNRELCVTQAAVYGRTHMLDAIVGAGHPIDYDSALWFAARYGAWESIEWIRNRAPQLVEQVGLVAIGRHIMTHEDRETRPHYRTSQEALCWLLDPRRSGFVYTEAQFCEILGHAIADGGDAMGALFMIERWPEMAVRALKERGMRHVVRHVCRRDSMALCATCSNINAPRRSRVATRHTLERLIRVLDRCAALGGHVGEIVGRSRINLWKAIAFIAESEPLYDDACALLIYAHHRTSGRVGHGRGANVDIVEDEDDHDDGAGVMPAKDMRRSKSGGTPEKGWARWCRPEPLDCSVFVGRPHQPDFWRGRARKVLAHPSGTRNRDPLVDEVVAPIDMVQWLGERGLARSTAPSAPSSSQT